MIVLLCFLLTLFASPFKSKSRLEAENAAPRHQLIVLQRKVRGRHQLTNGDRLFLVQLYRWFPSVLNVITIIRPKTLVRWHRAGFRQYWRWKSRSLGGRPKIAADLRALIRRMSAENPLWGAPRIHGELLNYGARRASMVSCSSSASRSLSRASRSTWSSDVDTRPKDGAPSCVTTHRTSPPWTCSLFRPLASICSMSSSSSGWPAETLSRSTSQPIRPRTGSHARSRRHSLGIRLRTT